MNLTEIIARNAYRLHLDWETGELRWKPRPRSDFASDRDFKWWTNRYCWKVTGSLKKDGALKVKLEKRCISAHRIVFYIANGYLPPVIDHANGNPADNRPTNLRAATPAQNSANKRHYKVGASGAQGVIRARGGRWQAKIIYGRKCHYCGIHDTVEQAAAARQAKAEELHGEFAYHLRPKG